MDQKILRQREAKCVQDNPPGCTTNCPVHVDTRGVIASVRKEDYAAGFTLFHKMVPFPGIISRICDQPCQQGCKRREIEEPVNIRALEQICVENNAAVIKFAALPAKKRTVAIVGAGLSGLTAALELSRKGYKVVLFEATDRLGGSIRDISEKRLPRQVIDNDFAIFKEIPVEIYYHTPIISLDGLAERFDAIYVGTGPYQNNFGLTVSANGKIDVDLISLATSQPKVFAGGSLRSHTGKRSPINSIADGKIAAVSIDRFLQNASLTANRENERTYASLLYTNIAGIEAEPAVAAADPESGYTKAEASREANRCLLCECLECVKVCEYLAHYKGYPKRYVREVYNNLSIVMGIHRANKMINSCSLCGLCEQVCPGKLSMAEIYREARQMMVEKGKMPPSTHDFALRDMQFSTSDKFTLTRHQPGFSASELVFYPGCQLAASSPEHVVKLYRFLCEKVAGGVGLMLGCCGAPASWAGQETLFQEKMQNLKDNWRSLGSPKVITACPTCYRLLTDNATDMAVESLWTLLERIGIPAGDRLTAAPQKLAVHDSCTTRHDAAIQSSVRCLLNKLGYQVEELPLSREKTVCCGYGGLMLYANPEVAHKVIDRRIQESELDYLAYCAMCRDNFVGQGKRSYHLLDLIFGFDGNRTSEQAGPGYSKRQENRARLKQTLLTEIWGEKVEEAQDAVLFYISEEVLAIMEERQILIDDVIKVIEHAESTGEKLQESGDDYFIAYFQPASVTYWVEYKPQGDGFVVRNAYCHRIEITE